MSISPIVAAIKQICEEKEIAETDVLEAIESALAAAYRKDFGKPNQNIQIIFSPESGEMQAFDVKTVVEDELKQRWEELKLKAEHKSDETTKKEEKEEKEGEVELRFNPRLHLTISEAKTDNPKIKVGDEIKTPLSVPSAFGRVAAQTAKQVIIQKLKEAEKNSLFNEFETKKGKLVNGTVGRREGNNILIDLGKITALLPFEEQNPEEYYSFGNRMKFYIKEVSQTARGPQILVSRVSPSFAKEIFATEIPEIGNGNIEIKAIAREAGRRIKVAVISKKENLDPVGACIGQRGVRIQTVMAELGGEKIDVIEWNDDPVKFITQALSPAKIIQVILDPEEHRAEVKAKPDQLALAIGRGGQNIRLASQLTGWQIDLKEEEEGGGGGDKIEEETKEEKEEKKGEKGEVKKEKKQKGVDKK